MVGSCRHVQRTSKTWPLVALGICSGMEMKDCWIHDLCPKKSAGFQHAFVAVFFVSPGTSFWWMFSSIIELETKNIKVVLLLWKVGSCWFTGEKKQDLSWLNEGHFLVPSCDITRVGSRGASKSPQKPLLASGRVCYAHFS